MARIAHEPRVYRRSPRLKVVDGTVWMHAIEWTAEGERRVGYRLGHGEPERAVEDPWVPELLGLDAVGDPCTTPDEDRRVDFAGQRCWTTHDRGITEVRLSRGGSEFVVYRARGIAMAPALLPYAGGTVVAFHSNVREDDGEPDVAKWIVLRFVDASGGVFAPAAPMTDRDRDREGVEQSFEFPTLCAGEDGAIALLGRGSHDYFRQDLGAEGFGPRQSLTDGEWGSRGRRIAAVVHEGRLFTARRDRRGLEIEEMAAPKGGPPTWAPVAVQANDCVATHRTDPRDDPAARWGRSTRFGDIQQHSAHSDGVGTAEEAYLRARDHYGDDFVALTDHESFIGKRTSPGEWRFLRAQADRHDGAGFVALHAYEWTGAMYPGPGHKCVYPATADSVIVSRDDVPQGRALVDRLRGTGTLASPHHIGWTGADAEAHDEEVVPVWEICSCHGCYEHADHPLGQRGEHKDQLVDVMLAKGLRFGFTASSDSHGLLFHHGECRQRDPYRTGLTAVQVETLDRASVLRALRERRCYATSGAKILLDVRVDGAPMGSFLGAREAVDVEVRAIGTGPLARIDLVGPAGTLASFACGAAEATVTQRVSTRFVYARVVQADGEMAWSSPVFVDG